MCIVSDRHASIINATSTVYDEIPHFACIWHLLQNIMKNLRKSQQKVTELFYSMAKTYTMIEFNQHMEIVEKIDKRIKDYLLNIEYNKWSRVHAQVNRTWMMTSNIAESVNSRTRHAKILTVLHLLKFMRQLVQKWNNNNRSKAIFSEFYLGKKYEKILQHNKTASEKLRVCLCVASGYDVVAALEVIGAAVLPLYLHKQLNPRNPQDCLVLLNVAMLHSCCNWFSSVKPAQTSKQPQAKEGDELLVQICIG
ncbi:uncharacterized protein LOC129875724 [Solanum dulcamara]|uniref:uncharacterized protein LOC129875724 n=1 Tax=Solanum dulcamara TaxID=45834 RepID=UPI002485A73E|nr:uncharacterized protein LOC129875724 [Solanum dulcamara]